MDGAETSRWSERERNIPVREDVLSERLVGLRRSLGGHAADVSRKHTEFRQAFNSRDISACEDSLESLRAAFMKLQHKHREYLQLAPDGGELDITHHDVYATLVDNAQADLACLRDPGSGMLTANAIGPEDSVSQHGSGASRTSSASSALAKAAAKRASLKARFETVRREQELEFQRVKLDHQIANIKLQGELEAAAAEEETLAKFVTTPLGSDKQRLIINDDMHKLNVSSPTVKKTLSHVNVQNSFAGYHNTQTSSATRGQNVHVDLAGFTVGPCQNQTHEPVAVTGPIAATAGTVQSPLNPLAAEWVVPTNQNGWYNVSNEPSEFKGQQLIDLVNLPKSTLMSFDGDPLKFAVFMNTFDISVGRTVSDDGVKLNRLLQYCKGKALRLIEPCALMDPSVGYWRARELLKERFGNDYQIAVAWVKKITSGPQIDPGNAEELEDFVDDLRACVETLRALRKLDEVDNRARMVELVRKLPGHIQGRWRKVAVQDVDTYGHYPGIDKLLTFLNRVSREVNDPIFGPVHYSKNKPKSKPVPGRNKGSSFNVNAEDVPASDSAGVAAEVVRQPRAALECYHCKGMHRLNVCSEFLKLSSAGKLDVARKLKLCYACLGTGAHFSNACKRAVTCGQDGCRAKHSRLLHDALHSISSSRQAAEGRMESKRTQNSAQTKAQSCALGSTGDCTALPILTVKVKGKGQSQYVLVNALLDPGSNKTFCHRELLSELGISGEEMTLSLETLSADGQSLAQLVSLEVTSASTRGGRLVSLPSVYAMNSFPNLACSMASNTQIRRWKHLKDLVTSQASGPEGVKLLIGQDVPQALIPLEVRHGSEGEPYAVRTALGWSICGPLGGSGSNKVISNYIQAAPSQDQRLMESVERFWKLDYLPGTVAETHQMSKEDQQVLKLWDETTQHQDDGHYVVRIPFKDEKPSLPPNRAMAEKRLDSLGKRLSKDAALHKQYCDEMNKMLTKGYAEIVPENDVSSPGMVWYLPHHPVKNPNKPGKVRIVHDCAAQYAGTSLNKEVLQGPDMTNKLIGVLLRFREAPVGMMSDIEAMFLNVVVPVEQRNALRFLWWQNGDMMTAPIELRMTVHLFGGVWSPSCAAYALRRTAEDNKQDFLPSTTETVMKNFYVDDCCRSEITERSAEIAAGELCLLLPRGGFHLKKWTSNSKTVLETIPEEDRLDQVKSLDLQKEAAPSDRVLGLLWNTDDDTLGIQIRSREVPSTRRGMLSVVSSVYDPLGLVSPFVLQAKKLFQLEVRSGKGWDEGLSPEIQKKLRKWMHDLPVLEQFKVGRCLIPSGIGASGRLELHNFCDASMESYAAVSYLRVVTAEGVVQCSVVMAKSRLAPIKTLTIPRLELQGAVLAVKLDGMIRLEMGFDSEVRSLFWTDSTIVLQYIHSTTKRFQTFVANRVAAIHEGSDPSQWQHVDSKNNPADEASRGLNASELVKLIRWTRGPEFLWQEETAWPVQSQGVPDLLIDDKEVKTEITACAVAACQPPGLNRLIERYSSWLALRKAVGWMLKFKHWISSKSKSDGSMESRQLTVDDLDMAESAIMRYIQHQHFSEELQSLTSGRAVSHQSAIYALEPVLDTQGILRVDGRLDNAPVADEAKHPIIIPKENHVALLIVREAHEDLTGHAGREHVLAVVRQRYWIPRSRPLINKIVRECVTCKRTRGGLGEQRMASLPLDRVTPSETPFSSVGIDCFGPFLVKRGRSQEKRYGCIFSCLTMRAVHLEKLNSLEADSFLNALIRFTARRGHPRKIRSDNGTNFVGGERELRESVLAWNQSKKISEAMLAQQILWEFNPPAASHMGGVWERQIRTVRKVLNSVVGTQQLDDERLDTLFCEVEAIVNSRPLTVVSDDPHDDRALTPNDLLLLKGQTAPPGVFRSCDIYSRRWRHVQFLADRFWRRWLQEYLPTLQLRQKWIDKKPNLTQGDMVLVAQENTPRKCWPLGRVTNVHLGKDGLVRSAEIRTSWTTMVRPVDKLCPLIVD